MKEFDDLVDIISRLRKECPWDREQTHESLAKHLIEEAYELLDALAAIQTLSLIHISEPTRRS